MTTTPQIYSYFIYAGLFAFSLSLMHLFSYLLPCGVFQHLFSISLLLDDIVSTTPVLLCKTLFNGTAAALLNKQD